MEENKEKELEEIKKKFFDDIQNETKIKNINKFFENCSDTIHIIDVLKKINNYFIKKYEICVNKDLTIMPIETEIYFANNYFYDGMCHMNDLQKKRFGQLYFHRYKNSYKINLFCGGVDICLSDSLDYYLSILIRSAFINDTKPDNLFSGPNNVVCKIISDNQKTLKQIEEAKPKLSKIKINTNNNIIYFQQRIIGKYYAKEVGKGVELYKLNCLNYDFLNNIIEKKQTFYKVPYNIKRIKKDFEEQNKSIV